MARTITMNLDPDSGGEPELPEATHSGSIRMATDEGIAIITLDQGGDASRANIVTHDFLASLERRLAIIQHQVALGDIQGVLFISAKPSIFIAGADIKMFRDSEDIMGLRKFVARGQDIFELIAALKVPTVAAIHGACLGGGTEFALACDYRIASDDAKTRLGFPETSLGILPCLGGCYRLPRLVGLNQALELVHRAQPVDTAAALNMGLVDQVVPQAYLLRMAKARFAKSKGGHERSSASHKTASVTATRMKFQRQIQAENRGLYPAPERAVDVICKSMSLPLDKTFELEEEALAELVQTKHCKNLLHLFFMREAARKQRLDEKPGAQITRAAVIGAGVMGVEIAQWSSAQGMSVLLQDLSRPALQLGMKQLATVYKREQKKGRLNSIQAQRGLDRVHPMAAPVPLKHVDLVIEATTENLESKQAIFAQLEARSDPKTILATNTSALSVTEIAQGLAHPERVIGLHFFKPVVDSPLVEIVIGERTSEAVAARLLAWVQASGKIPVLVKDSPGFVVNRVMMPYLIEAGNLVEQGADPSVIEQTMLDFGMAMGPFRLIDQMGLGTAQQIVEYFARTYPARLQVPGIFKRLFGLGSDGRASGSGFYLYPEADGNREERGDEKLNPQVRECSINDRQANIDAKAVRERLGGLMMNEAAMCLQEGIVNEPQDIDLALVLGAGFPAFRGGPLRMIDKIGVELVVQSMERYADIWGPQYAPCELLRELAKKGDLIYEG